MLKKDVVKQVVTDINAESNLDETGFKLDLILVGSVSIELQLTSTDNKALSVPITIYGLGMDQCDESEIKFRLAKRVADELISLDPGEYLDPAKVICVINSVSAGDTDWNNYVDAVQSTPQAIAKVAYVLAVWGNHPKIDTDFKIRKPENEAEENVYVLTELFSEYIEQHWSDLSSWTDEKTITDLKSAVKDHDVVVHFFKWLYFDKDMYYISDIYSSDTKISQWQKEAAKLMK